MNYDKSIFARNLRYYMAVRGISAADLTVRLHVTKASISDWTNGKKIPRMDKIEMLASILGVQKSDLIEEKERLRTPAVANEIEVFPVIGDLAAGFDQMAIEDWSGETVEIPKSYLKGHKKEEYIVLAVKGDSMYPLYQNGDKVLILRENSVPYSGAVCAVIYGDEFATIKKVELLKNRIRLVPINLNYGPYVVEGEELDHFTVIGIPKLLIREIDE